ncbi:cytochrome b561 and DOMON domain-containing protein At3g61750-like [Phalaenopsis equestris]|uniref:cytochrome b561 and DOMON domain-containing protein At3g61750-like n=1 Tax=Phalaenopsis equestris TaxID=78828 RepID=UPI0009E189FF|nr:cytochrome b561 and DOMON domain-containing protein At3g61750-like [Phalaenopsis equestris]
MANASFSILVMLLGSISLVGGQADRCGVEPNVVLPVGYGNITLVCLPIWNNLVLRYSLNEDNVLTIVLSMLYTSGWLGMGFSKDGMMVGSSAMVGWIGNTGRPHIKQFYLRGRSSSQVLADQGQLPAAGNAPVIVQNGPNIYMAFQLKFLSRITQQKLLFAFGTATPVNDRLTRHQDKTSVSFDFYTSNFH